ncbi:hypothetical protein ACSZMK_13100 [Aeromonas caviae]
MPRISARTKKMPTADPGEGHDDAGQQGLDEGDPDNPHGHGPDGAGAQLGQGEALALIGDAYGDAIGADGARLPPGHDDAGHDEGGDEAQQASPHAGEHGDSLLGHVAELRLVADEEAGQVHRCLHPEAMDLGTNEGDVGNPGGGGRDHQGVVLHLVDQGADAVAQGAQHGGGGGHDEQDAQQDQQGGRLTLFSPESGGKALMEGVKGDRQDQGPQHHVHERGEHGEAERA